MKKRLKIVSNHFRHIGQVFGPGELKLIKNERNGIRNLGSWDLKIQEKAYSTKLPLKSLKQMARFVGCDGLHYNTKTMVEPSILLQKIVFPWVDIATAQV